MRRLGQVCIAATTALAITVLQSSGPTLAGTETEMIDVAVAVDGQGGGGGGSGAAQTGGGTTRPEGYIPDGVRCAVLGVGTGWGSGGRECPDGEAAPPSAAAVAEIAREQVPVVIPAPQTSPPAGQAQLTGLRTWFWLDREAWVPVTARAELDGVWAEVTATPVRADWNPGDGGRTVICRGPAHAHPGHESATTDCGHTYTVLGDYSIGVDVTYEVTWSASTGESGTQHPIVLSTDLPIHVEQRQAVTT